MKTIWAALGAIAATVTAILGVWFTLQDDRMAVVFLLDDGTPCVNVEVVLSDLEIILPNPQGILRIDGRRAGEEVSIRDRRTGRELGSLRVPKPSPVMVRAEIDCHREEG